MIRDAFREFKVARLYTTGDGERWVANWRVPVGFILIELGYGCAEGPSIEETQRFLPEINARNRKLFEANNPEPKKKTRKSKRGRDMRSIVRARRAMAA
jgi:hypothetical protein